MRRILIEQARRKKSLRAGGEFQRVPLSDFQASEDLSSFDLLELDEALTRLEAAHPRKAQVVKMRYFGGLTISQTAESLGIAASTADADWAFARAWLKFEIEKAK